MNSFLAFPECCDDWVESRFYRDDGLYMHFEERGPMGNAARGLAVTGSGRTASPSSGSSKLHLLRHAILQRRKSRRGRPQDVVHGARCCPKDFVRVGTRRCRRTPRCAKTPRSDQENEADISKALHPNEIRTLPRLARVVYVVLGAAQTPHVHRACFLRQFQGRFARLIFENDGAFATQTNPRMQQRAAAVKMQGVVPLMGFEDLKAAEIEGPTQDVFINEESSVRS